jgi:eukaryotic-like serine/threonine-protein kinase
MFMGVDMLAPGTRLGDRYELREPVARGGMGEVWRADDPVLGRTVAVKVLLPRLSAEPGFAERFRTEARAMAALSDPSIVEVYDYGQDDGIAYLVMPFVQGESLHELLNRAGPLPPREAMFIVAQVANALQQAHRSGIVHRDVKPGNVLVRPDGRLMLTDFGIARSVAADPVTTSGGVIGTAAYLAPEQIAGSRVAPATDVYALGVVAYECLTMTQPFVADFPIDAALKRTLDEPPPLPDTIPPNVRHVVMRALAKDPDQRWPSAHAMAQAATTAARELPESPWSAVATVPARLPAPTAALPPILDEPRRHGRLWAGLVPIAAGVALLIAATAIALSGINAPSGTTVPPASVVPSDESVRDPQQTEPNQQGTAPGNDGGDDGERGGDNSGPGGGGGGRGGGDDGDDNSGPG